MWLITVTPKPISDFRIFVFDQEALLLFERNSRSSEKFLFQTLIRYHKNETRSNGVYLSYVRNLEEFGEIGTH